MAGIAGLATAALIVHILAAIVWVGGMFFAHQVLRPAAAMLEPAAPPPSETGATAQNKGAETAVSSGCRGLASSGYRGRSLETLRRPQTPAHSRLAAVVLLR